MVSQQTFPDFAQNPESENLFLRSADATYRYTDLKTFEHFFLNLLNDFGYHFNQPIGLLAPSSDKLIFIIAACWDLQIPFVSFNAEATDREIKSQISDIDPAFLFSTLTDMQIPDIKLINISEFDLDAILSSYKSSEKIPETTNNEKSQNATFGYFFTSGTSGSPKIVPLKRRQMVCAAASSAENLKPEPNHCWLLCLPLNHIGGISIILRSLLYGSAIYRMDKFNSETVAKLLSDDSQIQAASLVPTMLKRLLERPDFDVHKNFRAILLGGGPVDGNIVNNAIKRDIPIILSYGMTETCAQIAANPLYNSKNGPSESVGNVFNPNDIDIRNDKGKSLSHNLSGTIWLRGPQVFDGYANRSNKQFFDSEGWFNTGDFGHINEDGNLFIETRRTDLIISGGENISPYEVEKELEKIPSIKEAAVFGLPDEEWGQKVVALIVSESNIEIDTIQQKLSTQLSDFKIPKKIRRVEEIPRTRTGKIRREKLAGYFKESESA